MTGPEEQPAAPEPATPTTSAPRPPLSKVMLAMDVVDTLRHHRSIVETELNEDVRERALIERVRAIYEAQGIDVPDEVIREGVEALARDRFTYKPPERTLAVRLAELYVRRGFYAKIALVLLALGGAVWGTKAYANHKQDQALIQGFTARVDDQDRMTSAVEGRLGAVERNLQGIAPDARPAVIAELATDARARLDQVRERMQAWQASHDPLPAADYPEQKSQGDKQFETRRDFIASVSRDVGLIESSIQVISLLRKTSKEIGSTMAMLGGMSISDEDSVRIETMRKAAIAAIEAGDATRGKERVAQLATLVRSLRAAERAKQDIRSELALLDMNIRGLPTLNEDIANELDALRERAEGNVKAARISEAQNIVRELTWMVGVLDQAYEMRIISRHGVKSGLWRHPVGRPNVRNYYIQVEAIGADGRPQTLEFKNEEHGKMVKSNRVAIRVPKSVYEAVKKDKLDNGIVDNFVFGTKRRGEREPDYEYETDGGWITGE